MDVNWVRVEYGGIGWLLSEAFPFCFAGAAPAIFGTGRALEASCGLGRRSVGPVPSRECRANSVRLAFSGTLRDDGRWV